MVSGLAVQAKSWTSSARNRCVAVPSWFSLPGDVAQAGVDGGMGSVEQPVAPTTNPVGTVMATLYTP